MNQGAALGILILFCSIASFSLLLFSAFRDELKLLFCFLLIFASLLIVIGFIVSKYAEQEPKKLEWRGEIPPGREKEVVLKNPNDANRDYIVPKGKKLCLGTATFSCDIPVLQKIILPGMDIPVMFESSKQISIKAEFTEGEKITAHLHNLNTEKLEFALTIDAMLSWKGWKSYLYSLFFKIKKMFEDP